MNAAEFNRRYPVGSMLVWNGRTAVGLINTSQAVVKLAAGCPEPPCGNTETVLIVDCSTRSQYWVGIKDLYPIDWDRKLPVPDFSDAIKHAAEVAYDTHKLFQAKRLRIVLEPIYWIDLEAVNRQDLCQIASDIIDDRETSLHLCFCKLRGEAVFIAAVKQCMEGRS